MNTEENVLTEEQKQRLQDKVDVLAGNKLTEEQQKQLVDKLGEIAESNPETQLLRKIQNGEYDIDMPTKIGNDQVRTIAHAMESEQVGKVRDVAIEEAQPVNEGSLPVDKPVDEKEYLPTEDMKKLLDGSPKERTQIANKIAGKSLSDEDTLALFNLAIAYKADPDMNVVEALPEGVATMITAQLRANHITGRKAMNTFSRFMIDGILSEIDLSKILDNYKTELDKALAIPELVDMFAEHTREAMEKDLLHKADVMEPANKEKAQEFRDLSKAYTSSYMLDAQLELLKDDHIIAKMRKNISDKIFNRLTDDFDFFAAKSRYKIKKVQSLIPILINTFGVSEMVARKYVVLLCLSVKDKDKKYHPTEWYMYSSITVLETVSSISKNKSEFASLILSNVIHLFEELERREDELFAV